LLLAPGAANAAGTLDQQQTETSSYYFVEGPQVSPFKSGFSLAQTFTAGLSGSLDQVELPLRRRAQTTLPVNIQITSVESGGAPNNAGVLASTTVPASEIPTSGTGFVAITFTVPPSVVAGAQYAIVAYTADSNEGAYEWGGSTPNPSTGNVYAAGEPWASINSPPSTWTAETERGFVFDLGFKTYVTRPSTTLTTSLSGEGKEGEKITVKQGAQVTDRATLSGENASTATGTATYNVYGDSGCTKLLGTVSSAVSGGKSETSPLTFVEAGTYYWRVSYSGDENNQGSEDTCGAEVLTVTPKPATCGKTTVGKSSDALLSNLKRVNKCVLPNATVTELSTYLAPTSTKGQQLIKGIIYADSKGKPGARLGVTEQLTFKSTSAPGWYRLVFSTPVKVEAGTYWIGLITGTTSKVAGERYDGVKNAEDYNSNSYTSGPSNPFGSFKTTNEEMSLYASYTPEQQQCAPTRLSLC
jgi:hypothetical protein